MIRTQIPSDLNRLSQIWLETNLTAHAFIPSSFWEKNVEGVRAALPDAEVLVWDEEGIQGFIGLLDGFIAGLFVAEGQRGRGIGAKLLAAAKERYAALTLDVYARNVRAHAFYERNGFVIQREKVNEATGEPEYEMLWERAAP